MQVSGCNLFNLKCVITIPSGHMLCKKCNGSGVEIYKIYYKSGYMICKACMLCNGKGYIDWISNLTGTTEPIQYLYKDHFRVQLKCHYNKKCKVIRKMVLKFNKELKEHILT